jgi:hypothetical protein
LSARQLEEAVLFGEIELCVGELAPGSLFTLSQLLQSSLGLFTEPVEIGDVRQ